MFMLLLTVLFILFYLMMVVKGNVFYDFGQQTARLQIEFAEKGKEWKLDNFQENYQNKSILIAIFMIVLVIVELLYVIKGVTIDPLKYPSIIALFYPIMSIVFSKVNKNKEDLTTEEGREKYKIKWYGAKRRSFKSTLNSLLWLGYFSYMFWVLVF